MLCLEKTKQKPLFVHVSDTDVLYGGGLKLQHKIIWRFSMSFTFFHRPVATLCHSTPYNVRRGWSHFQNFLAILMFESMHSNILLGIGWSLLLSDKEIYVPEKVHISNYGKILWNVIIPAMELDHFMNTCIQGLRSGFPDIGFYLTCKIKSVLSVF
jgi:hypothetical protein